MSRKVVTVEAGSSGGSAAVAYIPKLKTYTLYDFDVDGQLASVKAQFTDMGVDQGKILSVNIKGTNLQSGGNWQCQFYPQSSGAADQNGYMGFSYHGVHGGNGQNYGTSHNSNQSFIWWPIYTSVYQSSNSYGGGMSFNFQFPVESFNNNKSMQMGGMSHYQQATGYNYPNTEKFSWDNYASNNTYPSIHGIKLKPSSGSFNGGNVVIEIWYKD